MKFYTKPKLSPSVTLMLLLFALLLTKVHANSSNKSISVGSITNLIDITGRVTDGENGGMPGVSIRVKGSQTATVTDKNGNYRIAVPDQNATLIFSYVGYATQVIPVGGRVVINVVLVSDQRNLDAVVVTGYGTQRKSDLTGSVASIGAKEINEIPVTSLEKSIQGRIAGVQVQQSSGQPGAGISMRIRGVSSIAGGNEPLYVIDGLPQFNDDVRGANGLATINPSDIQSIEVLKDASATAIYGSRGANGVVMITTKSGKSGKSVINLESSIGNQQVTNTIDMMNSAEYVDYVKRFYTNSNLAIPTQIANFQPGVDTDWQNEVFRTAPISNTSLSVSGGSEKSQYYISGGFITQDGVVINTGYKRGTIRMNLNSKISERISLSGRLTFSRAMQKGFSPTQGTNTRNFGKSGIGSTLLASPTAPVKNADGSYALITPFTFNGIDAENPVAIANEVTDQNLTSRIQGGVDLKAVIIKGLTNNTRLSGDFYDIRRDLYFPRILPRLGNNVGAAELGRYDKTSALAEDFLEYKHDFDNKISVEGVVGVSLQKERYNSVDLSATGFASDELKNYNFSSADVVNKPITDVIESTIISSFARARLSFADKYLFSASIRRDGASVFAENNKYGVFPSVSAAWRLSEEQFIKSQTWVSNLKLRASWGEAGNPAISPYQSLLLGKTVNTGQAAGAGLAVGLSPTFPNPNLKWETTAQTNVGVDAGFFSEKLRFTFDYYYKKTFDLLALVQLAPSAGINQIIENVGEVKNKGWEVSMGSNLINTKDVTLSVDFNLSQNNNRVTKTKNNQDIAATVNSLDGSTSIIRVGQPLSVFYGPKFIGLSAEGLPLHENLNGDKNTDGTDRIDALDNQILGSPYPDFNYGVSTNLKYKGIGFSMVWAGVSGSLINNFNLATLSSVSPANQYNKAKATNDLFPNPSEKVSTANRTTSSRFMESGDFFRLRNIRLDYRINTAKTGILTGLNVYVSGQNLITFTKYSGFDPEVNSFNGNDRRQGVDIGAYPTSKVYTLGFSANF